MPLWSQVLSCLRCKQDIIPATSSEWLFRAHQWVCPTVPHNYRSAQSQSKGKTMSFTYDNLGRLTVITYSNGTTVTFNYDTAGNRTSVVTNCPTGTC